jgi:P22_AR N-terminal domain
MEEKPDDYEVGEVLEPIEQHTLDFYGKPLRVVRLPNGEPGVVLNELCENMGLERRAQLRRIHRTKAIETGFASARIDTPGGPQVVSVLTLKVTPAWLFGIDADRARPEVRPEIERYQAECVDVLYRYFANKTPPILPDPQSAGMQPLAPPDPEAGHEEQATYHETMSLWHRWQADRHMQAWRKEMQLQHRRRREDDGQSSLNYSRAHGPAADHDRASGARAVLCREAE